MKLLAVLFAVWLLSGCTKMETTDFAGAEPRLILEEYFAGKTRAWGLFEDRFGNVRRQFVVDIDGTWDGRELVLDERFAYSDGEIDRRIWHIRKTGDHRYEGRADDVIGVAQGIAHGNALNWRYDMDLKINGFNVRVDFNDWMFLQSSDVMINRARVTKFGIELGEVTLVFMPSPERAEVQSSNGINGQRSGAGSTPVPDR